MAGVHRSWRHLALLEEPPSLLACSAHVLSLASCQDLMGAVRALGELGKAAIREAGGMSGDRELAAEAPGGDTSIADTGLRQTQAASANWVWPILLLSWTPSLSGREQVGWRRVVGPPVSGSPEWASWGGGAAVVQHSPQCSGREGGGGHSSPAGGTGALSLLFRPAPPASPPPPLPPLVQMQRGGVAMDSYSYNAWMRAAAKQGQVETVLRVVSERHPNDDHDVIDTMTSSIP